MRTKMFNILVVVATVVTLLPLAAFGRVASAQQVGPVGGGVVGEAQGVPAACTVGALVPQGGTPAAPVATNAAGTTNTLTLVGFAGTVTGTFTVEGFPATPQVLTSITTSITIKMDTPGTAYVTAVVDLGTGSSCYIQAKVHFVEVTDI